MQASNLALELKEAACLRFTIGGVAKRSSGSKFLLWRAPEDFEGEALYHRHTLNQSKVKRSIRNAVANVEGLCSLVATSHGNDNQCRGPKSGLGLSQGPGCPSTGSAFLLHT